MVEGFKTYDEQVEILKNSGVLFDNENIAKIQLEKKNFHNVINIYKDVFIDKNQKHYYTKYKQGTCFDYFVKIYDFFNSKLNNCILEQSITIEKLLKSKIAYVVAMHEGVDYLTKFNIFDYDIHKDCCDKFVQKIEKIKNRSIKSKDKEIIAYNKKYNGKIPIWCLVNILSFGDVLQFYTLLKNNYKCEIANAISKIACRNISKKDFENSIKIINFYRNLSAHGRVLFDNVDSYSQISIKHPINKFFNLDKPIKGILKFIASVYNVIDNVEFSGFINSIVDMFLSFKKDIPKQFFDTLLKKIYLPNNFEDIKNIVQNYCNLF